MNPVFLSFQKHDSSQYLLCLYCLRTFLVKFVSQGWGQTQTYYGHLLKHQSKSTTKKCILCRLTFFNSQDVKLHRKSHHVAHHKGVEGMSKLDLFFQQFWEKAPGQNWEKIIDFTKIWRKYGNDIEHNKGSKIIAKIKLF